jgi:hypothetical protein
MVAKVHNLGYLRRYRNLATKINLKTFLPHSLIQKPSAIQTHYCTQNLPLTRTY